MPVFIYIYNINLYKQKKKMTQLDQILTSVSLFILYL